MELTKYKIHYLEKRMMQKWYSHASSGLMTPTEPGWFEITKITPTTITANKIVANQRVGVIHSLRRYL